jgi:hypothetical protein
MSNEKEVINLIEKAIEEYIADDQENVMIHNELLQIVKKNEGKWPSKRIATALQKALPEYVVYWENKYGMYHIQLWLENYEHRKRFLLGYQNPTTVLSVESFEDFDICHGSAAVERIEKSEEILKNGKVSEIAKTYLNYIKARKAFNEAIGENSLDNPAIYSIKRALNIDQER